MAAGLSDSAFRSRRRRFLDKVARSAAMRPEKSIVVYRTRGGAGTILVDIGRIRLVFRMERGSMSNGETVLTRSVEVLALDAKGEIDQVLRTYTNWAWLDKNKPAQEIFHSIQYGLPLDFEGLVLNAQGLA